MRRALLITVMLIGAASIATSLHFRSNDGLSYWIAGDGYGDAKLGNCGALMFLPVLSIILGFSCKSLAVMNTDCAKVEVAG